MSDVQKGDRLLVEAEATRQVSEENQAKCGDLRFTAVKLLGDFRTKPTPDGGVEEYEANRHLDFRPDCVHPHPGVPIKDLLKEARLAAEVIDEIGTLSENQDASGLTIIQKLTPYRQLRAAREATNE